MVGVRREAFLYFAMFLPPHLPRAEYLHLLSKGGHDTLPCVSAYVASCIYLERACRKTPTVRTSPLSRVAASWKKYNLPVCSFLRRATLPLAFKASLVRTHDTYSSTLALKFVFLNVFFLHILARTPSPEPQPVTSSH